jgi:TonB family protein
MNTLPFLTWLAGTLLPLGALWLVYRVALRNERCFGYNRALLLLAPVVAVLWPLLPRPEVPTWLSAPSVAAPGVGMSVLLPAAQVGQATSPLAEWSAWSWLWPLYLAGVALGLGQLAWQSARLRSLARRLPQEVRPGYVLAYTGGQLPTSSFGKVVFWDETATLAPAEASAVLAHEVAHVQQRHTLDVLWLEVWRAVLWPNPFAHLLLPGLRLTHELLADQAAAAGPTETTPYPVLLARVAAQQLRGPAFSTLLQPFTFSFTLTRIAMLQNQIPVRRWKQWLVLPMLSGLFLVACRASKEDVVQPVVDKAAHKDTFIANAKEVIRQDSLHNGGKGLDKSTLNVDKDGKATVTRSFNTPIPMPPVPATGAQAASDAAAANHVYTYVEQMPQLPSGGGVQAITKQILDNFVYPAGEHKQGRLFASFTVAATGDVADVKIIKGLATDYDEATLAAIRKLPRFVPGKQSGQPVAVNFTVPIVFQNKP